jgi:tetratricopeptide (TPR) repeat protein
VNQYRVRILLFTLCVVLRAEEQAAGYFQRALDAIRKGDFAQAESDASAGLRIEPRSPAGYDLLGIAYNGVGRLPEAERSFRQALELNPRFLPARNDLGRVLYRAGKVQAASNEFESVLAVDSKNFTANYNLGLIARGAKQFEKSAQYLEKARERSPSDASTLLALTGVYLAMGHKDQADSVSRRLEALGPDDPQIHFSLGALLLEWKQYAGAAQHLERARVREPKNFELLHDLGQVYLHLKEFSNSEDAFLQALNVRPAAVDTLYQLGVLYVEEGHPDQAIQVLVRARQYAPTRPDILLLLGREAIDEGFLDDAVDVLTETVRIDPGKIEPHLLLGEALTRKKLFDQALAQYKAVNTITPSNPQSYVVIGRTFLYMRRYPEAERTLNKALALDRANPQAAYYLGLVAADKADYSGAQSWFSQALRADPKYFPALYDMGVNCIRQDDFRCARDFLERAKAAQPLFAQVYYRLSNVYRRLQDQNSAAQNFTLFKKYEEREEQKRNYYPQGVLDFVKETQDLPEAVRLERYRQQLLRAAELKPDDLNVLFMLAQVYLRTGKKQDAFRQIDKIAALYPDSAAIRMRSASLLTAFHHYLEALAELNAVLDRHQDSRETRFALAALYHRMDRDTDAIEVLRAKLDNSAAYHNLLGRVLIGEGQTPGGLKELQQAAILEPDKESYAVGLILEQAAAGELREAAKTVESARAKWLSSGRVRFAEAFLFERSCRAKDAAEAYQRAVELSWHWEAPHLALGHLRGLSDVLDQTVTLFPSNPWPHWYKALAQRRDTPGSESTEVRRALDLAPNEPAVYSAMLADSLRRNDCGTAEEIWKLASALKLAPRLDPASWCGENNQSARAILDGYDDWRPLLEMVQDQAEN